VELLEVRTLVISGGERERWAQEQRAYGLLRSFALSLTDDHESSRALPLSNLLSTSKIGRALALAEYIRGEECI